VGDLLTKIIGTIETSFSASHSVPTHPLCDEVHGHVWRVRIEIPMLPANDTRDIIALIRQYHGHDLDRYLPGVDTHCAGLAAYFREKLSDYPVSAIEVITDDGFGARIEWPVR
jgi:6-pyruvoyl tetrahydropterin synthase